MVGLNGGYSKGKSHGRDARRAGGGGGEQEAFVSSDPAVQATEPQHTWCVQQYIVPAKAATRQEGVSKPPAMAQPTYKRTASIKQDHMPRGL